jgi:uncharacterized protein (TIGR03083 family)
VRAPTSAALLAANDARFITRARRLTDDDWAMPSLCQGWSTLDVLAHMVVGCVTPVPVVGAAIATSRGSFDAANTKLTKGIAARHDPRTLLDLYEHAAGNRRGIGTLFPKNLLLGDHVIHELDVLLPLGAQPDIDPHVVRAVLDTAVTIPNPFVPAKRTSAGLRLVATDEVRWEKSARADAPVVVGPGWALLSVLANRPHAIKELDGPGVAIVAERLERNGHLHAAPTDGSNR